MSPPGRVRERPAGAARVVLGAWLLLATAACDGAGPGPEPGAAALAVDPVVLLVTSADHRADHLGAAWLGVDIDTPVLDALARRGTLFTNAWAASTLPAGAASALLTGTSPRDTGLLDPGDRLVATAPTLAGAFAAAGHRTVAVVSDRLLGHDAALAAGFDTVRLPEPGARLRAEQAVALARAELARASGPLFLWLHLSDGRWPHVPDPALMARYHDPDDDPRYGGLRPVRMPAGLLPPELKGVRDLGWPKARYKASLTGLDRALEPLLAEPRVEAGTVAFVGTTGLLLGEHGVWFRRLGPYPGSLRVPLVLAGPTIPAGLREGRLASTLDLGATLLAAAGASAPFPGRSLLEPGGDGLAFAVDVGAAATAVTDGRHLLVLSLASRGRPLTLEARQRGEREFYALADDPLGEVDLATEEGPELAALSRALVDWLAAAQPLPWSVDGPPSQQALAVFEAMGYLELPPRAPADPWDVSEAGR